MFAANGGVAVIGWTVLWLLLGRMLHTNIVTRVSIEQTMLNLQQMMLSNGGAYLGPIFSMPQQQQEQLVTTSSGHPAPLSSTSSTESNPVPVTVQVQSNTNHQSTSQQQQQQITTVPLHGVPIVGLVIDHQERLCLAQISNTLLKDFSYNEIHNRRVALGITCIQCTPVQLELLRRAGAMPLSSRRCGMITKREAERLVKSFLDEIKPPKLPDEFSFDVYHTYGWGCRGDFQPTRYNSSRAKCIRCHYCHTYFSPNKFIFHNHDPHETHSLDATYRHPDAANFNAWRRHLFLRTENPSEELVHAWEDVKAMFNGGNRKRILSSASASNYLANKTLQEDDQDDIKKSGSMVEDDDIEESSPTNFHPPEVFHSRGHPHMVSSPRPFFNTYVSHHPSGTSEAAPFQGGALFHPKLSSAFYSTLWKSFMAANNVNNTSSTFARPAVGECGSSLALSPLPSWWLQQHAAGMKMKVNDSRQETITNLQKEAEGINQGGNKANRSDYSSIETLLVSEEH